MTRLLHGEYNRYVITRDECRMMAVRGEITGQAWNDVVMFGMMVGLE